MARRADGIDRDEEGVGVAVGDDRAQAEDVAARLALLPKAASRA
jgi:hypothetical protein